jgi:hypothetical protein
MYLAKCTRPNIAFSVNLLARYSSAPTLRHWNGVKHVLRYLHGTTDMGLFYPNKSNPQLVGYADASCRHRRKNLIFYPFLFILFFLDTDPHLASVVCDLYLFSVSRYELCACVGTCVRVCVCAQIWSRHQPWEI